MPDTTNKHQLDFLQKDIEYPKPAPKHPGAFAIIKDFSVNTSTNAVPNIARSTSLHNRLFWIISLLAFTGIMFYFIIAAIQAYFEYPTQTSVSVVFEWPQAFPAVTICNYSPIRYDRFIGPYLNYTNGLNLTNTTDTTTFTNQQVSYIYEFLTYKLNRGDSINDYFFPLDGMMMTCRYNEIPCTASNFTWFITPAFGICYTFNAKLKNSVNDGIRTNADNGGNGVLELALYVHKQQYVPYMSKASGMVALVHDNAQKPAIELAGMFLAPGRHHKLSYTKRVSTFLPAPYTTCVNEVSVGLRLMYDEFNGTNYGYSRYDCIVACMQSYIYEHCGCGHPLYWTLKAVVLPGSNKITNVSYCNMSNPCYASTRTAFMIDLSISMSYCSHCTVECSDTNFIIKSSSLAAPVEFLLNDIKRFVQSSNITLARNWSDSWISEIQANYVSLDVSYETIRTDVYSQQATISPVDVLSNVGGQTGLWIGLSFLSLLEIVELIYRLLRCLFHKFRAAMKNIF